MRDEALSSNESLKKGFADMGLLFEYLAIFNVIPKVFMLTACFYHHSLTRPVRFPSIFPWPEGLVS